MAPLARCLASLFGQVPCVAGLLLAMGAGQTLHGAPEVLTNLTQLRAGPFTNLPSRLMLATRLTGTVLAGGAAGSLVVFDGVSIPQVLLTRNSTPRLERGARILVTGNCLREGSNLWLRGAPLVDNDGTHLMLERAAGVYLTAGKHPIRVQYFNKLGERNLVVSLSGPDLPRQPVADALLSHPKTNVTSGAVEWLPGLAFNCYAGDWDALPDFHALPVVAAGTVPNFDIAVAGKTDFFGMDFTGSIQIPREGWYTLSSQSDDGSRVALEEPSGTVQVIGRIDLPPLRRVVAGQLVGPELDQTCLELEGVVTYATRDAEGLNLELTSGRGRAEANVLLAGSASPQSLLGSRVRITGRCSNLLPPEGYPVAGRLAVPSAEQIQLLDVAKPADGLAGGTNSPELPRLTTVAQVKQMGREQAQRGWPVKVRGVITFLWSNAGFFLQDATGSIDVRLPSAAAPGVPRIGEYWEVEGVTFAEFAPNIRATRARCQGAGMMPEPAHPNWEQLSNGSLDTQYIEVQGVVSAIEETTIWLLTRGGRVKVQLPETAPSTLRQCEGALVRVRGCLIPGRDIRTQQVKLGEFALRNASLVVDEPAPPDPFALPLRQVADLLLFDFHASPIQRVRLEGVVLQFSDGVGFVMNGTNGLRLVPKAAAQFQPGDLVEMVGFPDLNKPSPVLRDALVRRTGRGQLPAAVALQAENLLDSRYDSTLVETAATLVSQRLHEAEQVLEMRSGEQRWAARLPLQAGVLPPLVPGSELRLRGVYAAQGGDRAEGRGIDSFELLLNATTDMAVLRHPSWWTARHALVVAAVLSGTLLLALVWIWQLRRQVEQRTGELKVEIDDHKRTELELEEKTRLLTREIDERVRMEAEVERGHKELLITSRLAGMSEVATSVLHNVGNVMTSVNLLSTTIVELVRNSKAVSLARLGELLGRHNHDLGRFVTDDARGRNLPRYVERLGAHLHGEQVRLLEKIQVLNDNIQHINEIVATQQAYATVSGVLDTLPLAEVVEDALRMQGESLKRHGIALSRDYAQLPAITMDRHKVLQIMFNLLENAKYACILAKLPAPRIVVRLEPAETGFVRLTVTDNGIGIPPENLSRIFAQGFSTRKDGHGLGLHSSILAAQDMGGGMTARSDGVGKGATFTLILPLVARKPTPETRPRTTVKTTLSP